MARVLTARYGQLPPGNADNVAMRRIIAEAGSLPPRRLSCAHAAELDHWLRTSNYAHSTKKNYANSVRKLIRWLWEAHGAEKCDQEITRYPGVRPRNVTVKDDEIERVLDAAPRFLRLWLLFCSDLGIRSGTAARIGPENYNQKRGQLRFITKLGAKLTLPITSEIGELIMDCNHSSDLSYVRQLRLKEPRSGRGRPLRERDSKNCTDLTRMLRDLRLSLGITRRFTPHDLRRTVAVAMLEATNDVRDVQALLGHRSLNSTIWYLDHDLRPVNAANLELIKGNRTAKPKGEQTA